MAGYKALKTPKGTRAQYQHGIDLKAAEQHRRAHQPFRRIAERAKPRGSFAEAQPHVIDAGGHGGERGHQIIAHQVQQPDEEAAEKNVQKEKAPDRP